MAKVLSRKVTIFINGKEVENTIKSLEAEAAKLRAQQRNLVIGSEEYIETSRKLKEIKDVLAQQKNAVEGVADAYGEARKKAAEWSNIVVGMKTLWQKGSDLFNWLKGFSDEAARMDDVYADVMKTTGLTRDEVLRLNEAFKGMDTRTAREELNRLAAEAGKLGIQGVEGVAAFTEAADKIKVALGEDLGEDATTVIGKMAEVYTRSTAELAGAGDLGEKMLRIGSAINSLGAASSAAEPHMVDFLARLGGMASQAGLSAQQVLGYASALDQSGVSVEKSATAFQNFMSKMMQKPGEFAAIARQGVAEFRQLMETDMDAAIKAVLAGLNEEGGMTRLAPLFKDLQMAGSGVTTMLTTLKGSLDKVNEAQAIANSQMSSGASIEEEFAVKNNTMQARLDKAKDTFHNTAEALGNALYPAMIGVTNAGSGLMKGFAGLVQLIKAHPGLLLTIAAALAAWNKERVVSAALWVKERPAAIAEWWQRRQNHKAILDETAASAKQRLERVKALQQRIKERVAIQESVLARRQELIASGQGNQVLKAEASLRRLKIAQTKADTMATEAATAATEASAAAMNKIPLMFLITALTTLGTKLWEVWKHGQRVNEEERETNRVIGEQTSEATYLFDRLEKVTKGSTEYYSILNKLNELYPDIISKYRNEKGELDQVAAARQRVIDKIRQQVVEQRRLDKLSGISGDFADEQSEALEMMQEYMTRKFGKKKGQSMYEQFVSFLPQGFDEKADYSALRKKYEELSGEDMGMMFGWNKMLRALGKYTNAVNEAYGETEKFESLYSSMGSKGDDPFGLAGKSAEQLQEELTAAEKHLAVYDERKKKGKTQHDATDYTKMYDEEKKHVDALRSAIATLNKEKAGGDQNNGTDNVGNSPTGESEEARKKREREEAAWERFGQNYERLIDKMNAKELTGVDKVVADVDNAIRKMKDDLEVMIKKHPEAQSMLDELKQKAESWKRTEMDKYIGKLTDTYSKLADRVGDTDGFGRLTAENGRLRDSLGEIDKAILQAEADLGKVSGSQRQELQWLIDDYKELKSEITGELLQRQKDNPPLTEVDFEQQWNEERQEFEMVPKLKVNKAKLQKMGEDAAKGLQDAIDGIEIEAAPFEKWCDAQLDLIENFASRATSILSSINTILDNIGDQELVEMRRRNEEETATLDEQLEQQLISQEEYNQRKKELDDEYNDKEKEIRKEQWVRNKLLSAGEATIEGALAVLKALNDKTIPSTAARIAMAATIGTLTAAQILAITSQPEPYAKGGYVPKRTVYQAGEAGPEWVASNSLLTDPVAGPVIEQLEAYQRGNRRALTDIPMAQLNMPVATRAARELGRRRSLSEGRLSEALPAINPNVSVTMPWNDEMIQLWRELATYLKDPKNRQAVISRQRMEDFEKQEEFLLNRARLQ